MGNLHICIVASMVIMDMLDTHTPTDTLDTMESVRLRPSLRLSLHICIVASMVIMDAGYPYTYGHLGYYGKREAEAKSEAEPAYLYHGLYGHHGYAGYPYTYGL